MLLLQMILLFLTS
uniref:Uncharacterized protein n=1 Tax=Arundo donax TaxID=35708 RepID=A0A0A9AZH9_ARUDO